MKGDKHNRQVFEESYRHLEYNGDNECPTCENRQVLTKNRCIDCWIDYLDELKQTKNKKYRSELRHYNNLIDTFIDFEIEERLQEIEMGDTPEMIAAFDAMSEGHPEF